MFEVVIKVAESTSFVEEVIDGAGVPEAEKICARLVEKGFKYRESPDVCGVAVFERHLKKGKRRVEVLASNFLGKFVQVTAWA